MNMHANHLVFNEETGTYTTSKPVTETEILITAKNILAAQVFKTDVLSNPGAVSAYLSASSPNWSMRSSPAYFWTTGTE